MISRNNIFLRNYRVFRLPIVDENENPVWPEMFPREKIAELREMVGFRHFSAQMMLEFINDEKTRLDPGALIFYDANFDTRLAKILDKNITGYACYWDPSGGRVQSDFSVCVLIYRDDKNRTAYIHDVLYLGVSDDEIHPLRKQCEMVIGFMERHNIRVIGIEVNGIGNALPEIMRDISVKRGVQIVVQKITNHQRKELRILDAIEPLLTTGKLFANEVVKTTPLISEMMGWTPIGGGHDDGIDAVAGALRMRVNPLRPLGQTLRPITAKTEFKV